MGSLCTDGGCKKSEVFKTFVQKILQRRVMAERSGHGRLGQLEKKKEYVICELLDITAL